MIIIIIIIIIIIGLLHRLYKNIRNRLQSINNHHSLLPPQLFAAIVSLVAVYCGYPQALSLGFQQVTQLLSTISTTTTTTTTTTGASTINCHVFINLVSLL
jgi:amino acid transporter